jgi:hypothetical protein
MKTQNVTFNVNRALTNRVPLANEPAREPDENDEETEQEDEVLDLKSLQRIFTVLRLS